MEIANKEITIIENLVVVEGVQRKFNFALPENVIAIQWHKNSGYIEYSNQNPEYIENLNDFANILDEYEAILIAEQEEITRPRTNEELMAQLRSERDRLMKEFQWRIQRYDRQVRKSLPQTDIISELDTYMQALADLPATYASNPADVIYPTKPS